MIAVLGIGWLTKEGYGCIRSELRNAYAADEGAHTLLKKDIFSHPFKNFARLDRISRMTAFGVSLALQDAGIEYSPLRKQDIGIAGTNIEGSLQSDKEYFRDYLEGGRTLSRANLFIYTLPSSPIGEAAIHFGLRGPVVYAASENNALAAVLDCAHDMLLAEETPAMLAGSAEADEALYFVLARASGRDQPVLCGLEDARALVETNPDLSGLVQKFIQMAARKASL